MQPVKAHLHSLTPQQCCLSPSFHTGSALFCSCKASTTHPEIRQTPEHPLSQHIVLNSPLKCWQCHLHAVHWHRWHKGGTANVEACGPAGGLPGAVPRNNVPLASASPTDPLFNRQFVSQPQCHTPHWPFIPVDLIWSGFWQFLCNSIVRYPCPFILLFSYWPLLSLLPPTHLSDWLLLLAPPLRPTYKPRPRVCFRLCSWALWFCFWNRVPLRMHTESLPALAVMVNQLPRVRAVFAVCLWSTLLTGTLQESCNNPPTTRVAKS